MDSDGQPESIKESPDDNIQSLEVSPKVETENEDVNDSDIKTLTEKLSAALMNVSAKDELVEQHAKVAEEAVAGWEKAENEVAELKKKLESAANKNSALEDRVNHLDGALKECVRQLRQARDEQEETIQEAVTKRTREFESLKTRLESRIVELENEAEAAKSEDLSQTIESLARENLILKHELLGRTEELEIRTIERDLSTQAAESASKQHLDSIKKVAKLEAECRKLRVLSKSSDGQSDGGERIDMSCSDSWASALIAELDQFKNEKPVNRSLQPTSSVEIDLMEDFLEMERLASLPEIQDETRKDIPESVTEEIEVLTHRTKEVEEKLEKLQAEKAELESEVTRSKEVENTLRSKLEAVVCEKMELEDKLEKMEAEKAEMQISWDITKDKYEESQVLLREAQAFLQEAEMDLEKIQKELSLANESKSKAESQLISLEAESRKTYEKIESLEEDVRKEKALSEELRNECRVLEEEISREREHNALMREKTEPKIKQEDITAAAGKLAECQKTISSLGKQLQSLATLEDFFIDTASIPTCSPAVSDNRANGSESWTVHKNEAFSRRNPTESDLTESVEPAKERSTSLRTSSSSSSPSASMAVVPSNQGSSEKNRNGFAKFFTRSKNGIHLEI